MEDVGCSVIGDPHLANGLHVLDPGVDDVGLRWLGETVSHKTLEYPLTVFKVTAPDHEDEWLPKVSNGEGAHEEKQPVLEPMRATSRLSYYVGFRQRLNDETLTYTVHTL
jgi:hypothetical protein